MIRKLNRDDQGKTNAPYHRPNDRWVEVVVQSADLDNQQLTTIGVKQRSLREQRKLFTWSVTALLAGALIIVMSSPYRMELLAPGELTSPHAQLLAGQGADRCAACHEAAEQSVTGWFASVFTGRSGAAPQSERCMKCHDQSFDARLALKPHNVPASRLEASRQDQQPMTASARLASWTSSKRQGDIACSDCHREHHGATHDLTQLTDRQCQVCHQNTMHAFELDHPQLVNYPAKRRSRIAFDHATHLKKHFPESKATFDCNACHLDDRTNSTKVLAGFDQTCAQCHDEKIRERFLGPGGSLDLLALPMLDMEAFAALKLDVGSWPLAATGDFDGPLPPIMVALLASDHQAEEILAKRNYRFDFADVDPDDETQVSEAATLVWAIKRLVFELARDGERTIDRRFRQVSGSGLLPVSRFPLTQGLGRQAYVSLARRWLPQLAAEVADQVPEYPDTSSTDALAVSNQQKPVMPELKPNRVSGPDLWWPRDEALLARIAEQALGRQDEELLAENPLKQLMSATASEPSPLPQADANNTAVAELPAEPPATVESQPQQRDRRGPGGRVEKSNPHMPMPEPQGELLAENPLAKPVDKKEPLAIEIKRPEALAADEAGLATGAGQGVTENATRPEPEFVFDPGPVEVKQGWFRDDHRFVLGYRPEGHADAGLQGWMNFLAGSTALDGSGPLAGVSKHLLSIDGLGGCRRCHTMDQWVAAPSTLVSTNRSSQPSVINWKASVRDPLKKSFTKFSHGAHMLQPSLRDCQHCHRMDESQVTWPAYDSLDASQPASNFLPIQVSNCASCHREGSTSNRCTTCHNYHVQHD